MKFKAGSAVLDIKSLSDAGDISGYASVFGNKDAGGDIVMPGAFAETMVENRRTGFRPKMLWHHDMREPIGRWSEFSEDGKGLFVTGRLNLEVQRGREAHALLKAGDIDGLSIGYATIDEEFDQSRGANLLKKVRLYEVSVVSMAMNQRASVTDVKSSGEDLRAVFARGGTPSLKSIEAYLRDGGFPDSLATAFVSLGKQAFRRSDSGVEAANVSRFLAALRGEVTT